MSVLLTNSKDIIANSDSLITDGGLVDLVEHVSESFVGLPP